MTKKTKSKIILFLFPMLVVPIVTTSCSSHSNNYEMKIIESDINSNYVNNFIRSQLEYNLTFVSDKGHLSPTNAFENEISSSGTLFKFHKSFNLMGKKIESIAFDDKKEIYFYDNKINTKIKIKFSNKDYVDGSLSISPYWITGKEFNYIRKTMKEIYLKNKDDSDIRWIYSSFIDNKGNSLFEKAITASLTYNGGLLGYTTNISYKYDDTKWFSTIPTITPLSIMNKYTYIAPKTK